MDGRALGYSASLWNMVHQAIASAARLSSIALAIAPRTILKDWKGETLWFDRRTGGWSWGRPDPSDRQTVPGTLLARSAVLESLRGRASLKDEVRDAEGNVTEAGACALPRSGAVHGALAHWKGSDDLATVVLPTGIFR